MKTLSDFHVHPDYSIDAVGTIEEYCEKAISLGLKAICFTTHYDYNPALDKDSGFWKYKSTKTKLTDKLVAAYLEDISKAEKLFSPLGLSVYSGIEIDYTPGAEKEAERLRSLFHFDYVLGSIHCINGYVISDESQAKEYFCGRSVDRVINDYIELLLSAAECQYFDALGHLDYCARFSRKYLGELIDQIGIALYNPVFEALKRSNIGIEINTSPFRSGKIDFHPSTEILNRAADAGVTISSVGSDCHSPEELGLGIKEAFLYLDSKGIKPRFPEK